MGISDAILQAFPDLNDDQREAIGLTEGPLLVIAGPGSGKTFVLVLRTLNLLLQGLSDPDGILLCTFTEKAAFELRDRLSLLARKLKYQEDLSQMHVGTIHGVANEFLLRYRHRTPLGSNYEVLDELTQLLFIFDRLLLYWIGEPKKEYALMSFPYRPDMVEQACIHFDEVVKCILNRQFTITKPPELKVCKECD